jgi:hypothetical protein
MDILIIVGGFMVGWYLAKLMFELAMWWLDL